MATSSIAKTYLSFLVVLVGIALVGCGPSVPESSTNTRENSQSQAVQSPDAPTLSAETGLGQDGDAIAPPIGSVQIPGGDKAVAASQSAPSDLPTVPVGVSPPRRLPQGLSPDQLVAFLASADEDLRTLVNRSMDSKTQNGQSEQAMLAELRRIIGLKHEAAKRLTSHPDASTSLQSTGKRGQLQSLSHLASLGDLPAASELERFAGELSRDSDPNLRADSSLVLIGLALERVRFGKETAVEDAMEQIQGYFREERPADVAALMVMGQAIEMFIDYGHPNEASGVGRLVRGAFESSPDAAVREMALQMASLSTASPALGKIETLRQRLSEGESATFVDAVTWREAMQSLVDESAGLETVQAIAQLSLEAEAFERPDLADVNYALLEARFADLQDDAGREARTALQAKKNRSAVIGLRLDPDLPTLDRGSDSSPLSMENYRGKVVLMPFWSSQFPESLALVPQLRSIVDQNPDRVAIVGVNLDVAYAQPAQFARQAGLTFPSFHSVSDPLQPIVNEVAYRFGAVTVNFLVIVDPEGRVAAVNFSGRGIQQQVEKLLQ